MRVENQHHENDHFESIQAMRALAALMVVVGHFLGTFKLLHLPAWLGGELIHTFAYAGVDIFFVISGTVVCTAANRTAQLTTGKSKFRAFSTFLFKRIFRIYPVYLFVLAFVLFFAAHLKIAITDHSAWKIISTALLIDKNNPFIPQAWSLSFELYFYLVLAGIILLPPRYFFHNIAVWLVATIGIAIGLSQYTVNIDILFDPLIIEFGFGCLIAYLIKAGTIKAPLFALVIGFGFFGLGAYMTFHQGFLLSLPRSLSFGLGSAFLLYGLIGLEIRKRMRPPSALTYLGNISYSIYLWHELLISLWLVIFGKDSDIYRHFPLLSLGLFLGVVIIISALSYRLIEQPFRLNGQGRCTHMKWFAKQMKRTRGVRSLSS
jgi:peptidoglycan/LPS O-acetylase OafA/YrhL